MKQYRGNPISPGIAAGKILFLKKTQRQTSTYSMGDMKSEIKGFEKAKKMVSEQLKDLHKKALAEVGNAEAEIFNAYRKILDDEEYNKAVYHAIQNSNLNVEQAVSAVKDKFVVLFSGLEDEYFRTRAEDIKEVSNSLIRAIAGEKQGCYFVETPVILVKDELTPGELIQLDRKQLQAIITRHGSSISHTAILARSIGIPMISGVDIQECWDGKNAIADGMKGEFIIEPDDEIWNKYLQIQESEENRTTVEESEKLRSNTKILANINCIADVKKVLESKAAGIGLFRSEFLYLEKGRYPTEEEQYEAYKELVQKMGGKKVVIRTFDIRSDKQLGNICAEPQDKQLRKQLRAICRASAFGMVSVLFPMITSVKEVLEIKKELKNSMEGYDKIQLGVMIETPEAVKNSELLAKEVDFISIGTNDLTQSILKMDRQNEDTDLNTEKCQEILIPMIETVIHNAHKQGCSVGICGEMASDLKLTEIFVKMGIDELSVTPHMVPFVQGMIRKMEEN